MKKKSVYNLLMAAAVVLIVIAGLMMVGSVKGWQFPGGGDKEEKTAVSAPGEDGEDPAGGRGTEQGNVSGETAADTEADTEESAGNANFDIADTEKGEDVLPALVTAKEKTGGVNIERMGIAYRLEDGTKLRDGDILQTLNGATVTVDMDGLPRAELRGKAPSGRGKRGIFRPEDRGSVRGYQQYAGCAAAWRFSGADRGSGVFRGCPGRKRECLCVRGDGADR